MTLSSLTSAENLDGAQGLVLPARSGLMTVIAADADVFAFVNLDARTFYLTCLRAWWVPTTGFTVAQALAIAFYKAYGFTAVHTGGSPVAAQAHFKSQAEVAGSTAGARVPAAQIPIRISGTAAMTSGTYVAVDADEPEWMFATNSSALPVGLDAWVPGDGIAIPFPRNTGLVGKSVVAMGAAGVGRLVVIAEGYRQP
jgi:hypothetical protein